MTLKWANKFIMTFTASSFWCFDIVSWVTAQECNL